MKYEIKNWSEFQQYKDDRPLHWIKLHVKLLDDFNFNQLSEIDQLHLVKLWLVAAKQHGKLEGDEKWLARLVNSKKVNINNLLQSGFIVRTDSYESVPREEKRREEESRVEKSREEKNIVELKPDCTSDVFEFWRLTLNHPKAALDSKRKALIRKHLKNYDADDLKKAIRGCSLTPFNMGDNDRGQVYDSLSVILKDGDQIDRFMKNADNPPTGKIKTINQTQNEAQAQVDRITKHLGWNDE